LLPRSQAIRTEIPVTVLRFSGGEVIEVNLSLDEVRTLLQEALANQALLELQAPDGEVVVINPNQVQYLQIAENVEPLPGDGGPVRARA
jgi:Protein of unknown function (DUF3107)